MNISADFLRSIDAEIFCRLARESEIFTLIDCIGGLTQEERIKSTETMSRRIGEGRLLGIFQHTTPIGFIGWSAGYHDDPSAVFIEQITIRKDLRGLGMGKKVLQVFIDMCRVSQVTKIYAQVDQDNERSLALFSGIGAVCIDEDEARKVFQISIL